MPHTLKEKIRQDLAAAQRNKEELKLWTLRLLILSILNKEKQKRAKLSKSEKGLGEEELVKRSFLGDEEVIGIIASEVKKRKEASLQFEKGNRSDLAQKEKQEAEFLKKYLPAEISEQELRKIISHALQSQHASSIRDMGKVMGEVMLKTGARADGATVSKIVKEMLSSL